MVLSTEEWLVYSSVFAMWLIVLFIIAPKDPPEGRV